MVASCPCGGSCGDASVPIGRSDRFGTYGLVGQVNFFMYVIYPTMTFWLGFWIGVTW
uniref:Uncharacterized protein n=1 Tax=Mycobacterium phage QTRlifeCrisis TaxID=3136627 RepID=A0AAU8GRH5_9VIRU